MEKDYLMYLIIFLVCVLITGSVLFLTYTNRPVESDIMDTLLVELSEDFDIDNFDYFEYEPEPVQQETPRRSFLDRPEAERRTFLNRTGPTQQLSDNEEHFMSLVEQIRALFGTPEVEEEEEEEEIEEEEEEEIDLGPTIEEILEMKITTMTAQIDSLVTTVNYFVRNNYRLQQNLVHKNEEIKDLNQRIVSLRETILWLENEIEFLNTPIEIEVEDIIEEIEPDYRQLARIYNNMDPSRVAQILQTFPPETAVNILMAMNQRNRGRVMSALPPRVVSQYSEIILN